MIIGIPESNLVLVRILVRPALLAGREKGGTGEKTDIVQIRHRHRLRRAALCRRRGPQHIHPGNEDSFDTTLSMCAELDWLIYNVPLEYAQMVLDGSLESYLRRVSGKHSLELDD